MRRIVFWTAVLAAMGGVCSFAAPVKAPMILVSDFESGTLEGWNISGNAPTVVSSPVRAGRFAMKTSLNRATDKVPYRTEISGQKMKMGGEYWYGFSIYFPDPYPADGVWEIPVQWHAVPDFDIGEQYRNPPLALQSNNGKWVLVTRWDSKRNSFVNGQKKYDGQKMIEIGPYRTGVWTDWVFHIKWSYGSDGIMEVWQNGRKVIARKGPNTFNDAIGPYLKMGMYKGWKNPKDPSDKVSSRVLYHDEVRIAGAGARYEDVSPEGKSPLPDDPSALRK